MGRKRWWIALSLLALSAGSAGALFVRSVGVRELHPAAGSLATPLSDVQPGPHDWPWWRGTDRRNVCASATLPVRWSQSENVLWHAAVPGRGHSAPCVWGNRIFLSTADGGQQTISLLGFDRDSGRMLWQSPLHQGGLMSIHTKNSHASATPAVDGRHAYVIATIRGALWVTAVDFAGKIAWQREVGPFETNFGYGSSVVLYKSLVIVAADNRGNRVDRILGSSCLTALDRQTGQIVWRALRSQGNSYGTPIVARLAGRDQLVQAGKDAITSYDPATGYAIWTCRWPVERTANTVAFDDTCVYASATQPSPLVVCVRCDGRGDVTESHVVWRETKIAGDVPSPIVHDGKLYAVSDNGVLACLETASGTVKWKRRLGGSVSSSPMIAGGYLYCSDEQGTTYVVRLGGTGEIVARNSLGDGQFASPVVSGDRLYFRTLSALFCVSAPHTDLVTEKSPDSSPRL